MKRKFEPIVLTGLDGSNPLAFLAALGVLRCLAGDGRSAAALLSCRADVVGSRVVRGSHAAQRRDRRKCYNDG